MKNILVLFLLLLQNAIHAYAQQSDTFKVYFERNDATLSTKGKELINKLIADGSIMQGQKLTLLGYADYLGSNGRNDSLSFSRAKNVEDHLVKSGFSKKDIELCVGKGKIDRTPAGKDGYSQDRKVQIIVTGNKMEAATTLAGTAPMDIEMVKVPGGGFHFAIGKYHITQAQWDLVMGRNWSRYRNCDSCPVAYVNWSDIQSFLHKLDSMTGKHYRLPTEAEWEYAAKGGTKSHNYMYAGSNDIKEVAWHVWNSNDRCHAVGQKKPNELGIYDMSGNVWQWCSGRIDPAKGDRVLRGGAFFLKPVYCRVGPPHPGTETPIEGNFACGFRVALSTQ